MNHRLKHEVPSNFQGRPTFQIGLTLKSLFLQMHCGHIYLRARLIQLTADASLIFASCFRLQTTVIYGSSWHQHQQNILVH